MIINYPTGLYKSIIPVSQSDVGNVTFTISNNVPPRTNLVFPKLPTLNGVSREQPVDVVRRRSDFGKLIFTVSSANRSETGNANATFTIGRVLEFNEKQVVAINPMLVPNDLQIRHDVNNLDYGIIGVDEADQNIINNSALEVQNKLTAELNEVRLLRLNAETIINIQQKIINDTNRAIGAMQVVYSQSNDNDIKSVIDKLNIKLASATSLLGAATADANTYASKADEICANLRTVSAILQ